MSGRGRSSLPIVIGLALVALFVGAILVIVATAKEGMRAENLEHRVVVLANIDKDSDPDRVLIETGSVGTLWVKAGRGGTHDADETVMTPLSEAQAASDPVAVAYEPMTREIRKTYVPKIDTLASAAPGEGSGRNLLVKGAKTSSPLILSASRPRFAELRARLETALRDESAVALAVPEGGHEILDALVMP